MLILSTHAFQVANVQFQDQLEDLVSPICAVGAISAIGAIRPWAVVVLPSAALVLYTQLEISIKWRKILIPPVRCCRGSHCPRRRRNSSGTGPNLFRNSASVPPVYNLELVRTKFEI